MSKIRVNDFGYIERKTSKKSQRYSRETAVWREWWIIKSINRDVGYIHLGSIFFPKKYIGKKVRFKLEILK